MIDLCVMSDLERPYVSRETGLDAADFEPAYVFARATQSYIVFSKSTPIETSPLALRPEPGLLQKGGDRGRGVRRQDGRRRPRGLSAAGPAGKASGMSQRRRQRFARSSMAGTLASATRHSASGTVDT